MTVDETILVRSARRLLEPERVNLTPDHQQINLRWTRGTSRLELDVFGDGRACWTYSTWRVSDFWTLDQDARCHIAAAALARLLTFARVAA